MSTEVHWFLPNPASPADLREAHPYGPGTAGFHPDLGIEINPSQLAQNRVVAVVSGMARLVLDPLSPQTCTLVLVPHLGVMNDLSLITGKCIAVFVYRNLVIPELPPTISPSPEAWPTVPLDDFRISIKQLEIATLPPPEPPDQLSKFLNGELAVDVHAGDRMFVPSTTGGTAGWGRLGFEIVFVPNGLWDEDGWDRMKELIDPAAATRRLDPISFYTRAAAAPDAIRLTTPNHALATLTTRRILLELRNEYDGPFTGTAIVYDGGQTTPFAFQDGDRGTVELPAATTFCTVDIPDHVLTELPSGDVAESSAMRNFTTADHWALQSIFMALNPALVDDEGWFVANVPTLPRYTENNRITPILDALRGPGEAGAGVFRQYAEAIRTLTQPDHFMYLAGWWMDNTFELIPGDSSSTMAQLTRFADANTAQVRAMLWKQQVDDENSMEVYDINHLNGGNGQAILDDHTHECTVPLYRTGTHHQKFLVIRGSEGEFAFCGGVDLNANRRDSPRHGAGGTGYHDVHAKVEGPAVADIRQVFEARWNSHPQSPSSIPVSSDAPTVEGGSVFVQVACTYPRLVTNPYPFAPSGSTTPLQAFLRAIKKARKFIYIEDQYLTPYPGGLAYGPGEDTVGVLEHLKEALPRIDYLIMVVPNHARQGWLYNVKHPLFPLFESHPGQNRFRRMTFIAGLRAVAPEKVHVFYLKRAPSVSAGSGGLPTEGDGPHTSGSADYPDEIYCHSKVWIIDDVIAKIGSANCNRRSYTHDSEMDIVMVDGALDNGARRFARDFRVQLWAEHLGVPQSGKSLLEDHRLALHYWLAERRFASAHIADYVHTDLEGELATHTTFWDEYVDPDGR
ncbi:MAG TPA: hypothetical protein VHG08_16185 [Longimicrobium sp.]|nr:hypothetical protein [Longimicrobium sp.]